MKLSQLVTQLMQLQQFLNTAYALQPEKQDVDVTLSDADFGLPTVKHVRLVSNEDDELIVVLEGAVNA